MLYEKMPQQNIVNPTLTTIQQNMNHKGASHVHYCLGIIICLVNFKLRTNAIKAFQLSFFLKIYQKRIIHYNCAGVWFMRHISPTTIIQN